MKPFLYFTALSSLLLATPTYAASQAELEKTVQQLQAQVNALQAQITALKPLVEQQKKHSQQYSKRDLNALEPAANYTPATQQNDQTSPSDVKVSLKPGPVFETRDGKTKFGINGFVQGDAAWFQDDIKDQPNGTTLRRARLSVKGNVEDWAYKFETDFADNATKITDAFIDYNGFENVVLRAGQFKEPFSLEELTSDRFITFVERALPNALAPSRNIGVSAATFGDNWSLTAGTFGADAGTASSDDEANAFTARATYAPIAEDGMVVHLGVAGSYRQPDSATDALRYRSRPETKITDTQAVDTGSIANVDDATLFGLEAATVLHWFSLQGEYMQADLNRHIMPDVTLDGYYVQASAFLTGESRTYKPQEGIFDRVTPRQPFSLKDGTWGAWEVAARYSNLDLNDGSISGGEVDNYTVGLNWYPTANLRLIADYVIVDTDNSAVTPNDDPQFFTLRGQVDF